MPEFFVGLMSGTSLDAVDAVLVDFAGRTPRLVSGRRHPFPRALKDALLRLHTNPVVSLPELGRLDVALGRLFADAALELLDETTGTHGPVRAVGSHGQTVYHQPDTDTPFSFQLGDPNIIAEATGIQTVADFRRRDMAAGGQGAPLVPAFHADLFRSTDHDRAVLNIGGIANLTLLPADPDRPVTGFDTGPGNGLLDAWTERHRQRPFDEGGAWAATGRVRPDLLEALSGDPFFSRAPPKSTGREHFNLEWLGTRLPGLERLPPEDVQATLCELSAGTVAEALGRTAPDTRHLLVCGGGVHNRTLMKALQDQLPGLHITSTREHGLEPDWVEAVAFAWLARRTLAGQPGNLPTVTGARHPVPLGAVYPGRTTEATGGNPDKLPC